MLVLRLTLLILINSSAFASVASEAPLWDAQISMVNFQSDEKAKVKEAVHLIRQVIASDEFRQRVLGHQFEGKNTYVDNMGLSNEDIYKKIMDGSETLVPEKNGRMDVELELYHQSTNTIGYTYPNTNRIWINRKYFTRYTPVQVADNLFHEWLHKLGFDHATKNSPSRNHSVPYAIGYLVEELAAKL